MTEEIKTIEDRVIEILETEVFGTDGHILYPMPERRIKILATQITKELKQEYREEVKKMIEDYDWCDIHTTMHYPTCEKCKVRFDIKKKLENL